ncbi:MAG: MerR family transcriptional regulator [Pseudolabrys sp.]
MDHKAPDAFRSISEVADELDLPQHVLRFWESRFHDIRPMKRGGGRRYYRPDDVNLLRGIRHLLYGEGYTIRGVQRILREQGAKFVGVVWQEGSPPPPHRASEDEDFSEEAASATEMLAEESGVRRRLAALIGHDFGDRETGLAARHDPPLESAPVPRIEPSDRAIYGAPEPAPPRAPQEAVAPAVSATPAGQLARDDVGKLQAVLHELTECRKLIEAAAARGE